MEVKAQPFGIDPGARGLLTVPQPTLGFAPAVGCGLFWCQPCLMNVPSFSSATAWRSCSWVFITMGPYQATGSSIGFPDTSRNRIPPGPACTVNSSPWSNSTNEWLLTSYTGGASGLATCSVRTARGFEASWNVPEPANT